MIGHSVGPYRVLERLGAGGMGEVYLAEDPRLERKVALKCPSHEWLSQPDARERLHREARAAARLTHPNIAAVYDVLDVGDRPYIVMEYVEGESLSMRLRRGRLPVEQAVQIALQIAEAVADAHANGVLHRDLKPGNVCVTRDGRVKVLDFGLAKMRPVQADPSSPPSLEASLSQAGQLLGTPGYAAPEQLTGKTADQRSDVFALGVILFEMVTGRLPFTGTDAMSLALATVTEPAPSVRALTSAAPPELAAAVAHALEKNPRERFQSAAHFAAELRRIAVTLGERPTMAVEEAWTPANPPAHAPTVRLSRRLAAGTLAGVIVIAGIIAGMRWVTERAGPAATRPPVVAVLPFTVTGDDRTLAWLAVGLAETLTSDLTKLPGLVVVPRAATLAFVGPGAVSKVSHEQGTSHVVQGTLATAGADVSLDVSLVASDGRVAWRRQYTGGRADVPEMGQRLRQDLATVLTGALSAPLPSETGGTLDAQAYEYFSQARALLDRRDIPENITRAIELFRSAIARDPRYALAYLGLFEAYWAQYALTKDRDLSDRARDALIKAQGLQPNLPGLHYQLAVLHNNTGHVDDAMEHLQQAITHNPNDDAAYRLLGRILFDRGDIEAGIAALNKAVAIRPNYSVGHLTLAYPAYRQGRYQDAEAAYRRVAELQPESPASYEGLALVYHTTQRLPQAEENYKTAIRLGAKPNARVNLAQLYSETGRYREAVDVLDRLVKDVPGRDIYWRILGDAYRDLGRQDLARGAYTQGIAAAEQALKVNPKDAPTLSSLAVSEAKIGASEQASLHAQQALDLSPKDGDVLYRASVVSVLAGDAPAALAYLRRALEAGYNAQRAAQDKDFAPLKRSPQFADLVSPKDRPPAGPR